MAHRVIAAGQGCGSLESQPKGRKDPEVDTAWTLEFRLGLSIEMHQHMPGCSQEEFLGQSWTILLSGVDGCGFVGLFLCALNGPQFGRQGSTKSR